MNLYQDINLICLRKESFVWTKGEQTFMYDLEAKGKILAVQEPKRCVPCRKKKKEQQGNY